jgi:apolipoprotein N-acyltransferase
VTAVIDEQGRVTGQLPQFETGVLRADVPVMLGTTPYARWGLAGLGILMSALWLGVVALTLARRSR